MTDLALADTYFAGTTEPEAQPVVQPPAAGLDPTSGETAAVKRQKLMSSGDTYKDSQVHQTAALTWATVEVSQSVDALAMVVREQVGVAREQTQATREQTESARELLEVSTWHAQLVEAQIAESRLQSQMQYYSIRHLLPADVAEQMRAHLGIGDVQTSALPSPAPIVDDGIDFS